MNYFHHRHMLMSFSAFWTLDSACSLMQLVVSPNFFNFRYDIVLVSWVKHLFVISMWTFEQERHQLGCKQCSHRLDVGGTIPLSVRLQAIRLALRFIVIYVITTQTCKGYRRYQQECVMWRRQRGYATPSLYQWSHAIWRLVVPGLHATCSLPI